MALYKFRIIIITSIFSTYSLMSDFYLETLISKG